MSRAGRLVRWITGTSLPVWYHRAFRLPLGQTSRGAMDPRRADNVLTWLLDRRLTQEKDVHDAPEASFFDLRRVHDDAWLAVVDTPEVVEAVCGAAPLSTPAMVELWRRGCGATLDAARYVVAHGGRAATLMGGFHHAAPGRGAGFCALNDVASAIAALREGGLEGTILVIDLDAHPPDGLAEFELNGVDLRSVSVESSWTTTGFQDVRIPPQSGDAAFLKAVRTVLTSLGSPVLAFYLAGADPLTSDPLGNLDVSLEGLRSRDQLVFSALKDVPTVILPAGGYTLDAWKAYAHTLAVAVGSSESVDPDYDPIARRVGRVARTLAPLEAEDFEITEADLVGLSPETTDHRFLGQYSRHGLEYAFVRYGLFETLEQAGFENLEVSMSTTSWPHRLWVEGTSDGKRHRVAELSLRFSHWEGFRLLFIDWLELKDPRRPAGNSKLPGQRHPGLGLVKEVINILGVTARTLNLAGLQFVPSHYHVAWIVRTSARHQDPQARGEFLALRDLLDEFPLGAVSRRLHSPGLPTEDGEMFIWKPSPMIHALDDRLRARMAEDDGKVRAICRNTRFRLAEIPAATFDEKLT